MKSIVFIAALLCLFTGYSQQYSVVQKVNKKCIIVSNEEGFYGLQYNKKLVQDFTFEEFDTWNGLINFYSDSSSVCWDENGKKILEFSDAKIFIGEGDNFLFVDKENLTSLYARDGREVLPFGKYEFEFYQNGITVKNQDGEQAFYDESGYEVLPFANRIIAVVDDYEDVISVEENGKIKVLLNDRISPPDQFSKLNDFTFVQDHEVTVEEYLYFLGSQQYDGYLYDENAGLTIPASTYFPDTMKVETKLLPLYRRLYKILSNEEWLKEYEVEVVIPGAYKISMYLTFELSKQEKVLAQFPVTGVTKEQAEAYCKWLSLNNLERTDYDNSYESYAEYRLPSNSEWEEMAGQALANYKRHDNMPDSLNKENCMMFVYQTKVQCKNYASYLKASKGGGSTPSRSGSNDLYNRYQVFGNVAEMTSEEGIAKGGSYAHPAAKANSKEKITYTEPQPWLGFRIVGEYHY